MVTQMPPKDQDIPASTREWIVNWIGNLGLGQPDKLRLSALAGDGSTRQFFRVTGGRENYVLLWDPQWKLSQNYSSHQSFLKQHQIRTPQFFGEAPKDGFLLMEDLGDTLVQHYLQQQPEQSATQLKAVVCDLADLQGRSFPVPDNIPATRFLFNAEKFQEELQFTETHLVKGFLSLDSYSKEQNAAIKSLCQYLGSLSPRVFCHRDFHTRNLLRHKGAIYWIDFQDARMGSAHYDLASLLYDPYFPISTQLKAELSAHYKESLSKYAVSTQIKWEDFDTDLKLTGVQRMLKAAGSFAFFYTGHQKTTHLAYLIPALKCAQNLIHEIPPSFGLRCFELGDWIARVEKRSGLWEK